MTRILYASGLLAVGVLFVVAMRVPDAEVPVTYVGTLHVSAGLDGDSAHLDTPTGETIELRLADFDAPELSHFGKPAQQGAQEARQALIGLVGTQTLTCTTTGQSSHLRAVVTCRLPNGVEVSEWMAAHGWGYASSAGHDCRLEPLVEKAERGKLGIFGLVPDGERQFPWVYRNGPHSRQGCPGEVP